MYTDDIDIIEGTNWNVTAAFSTIDRESVYIGLAVNEGKKSMFCRQVRTCDVSNP